MLKPQLIDAVAVKTGFTKKVSGEAVTAVFEAITDALRAGEIVNIQGVGKWYVEDVPTKDYRNPSTGEAVTKEAHRKVKHALSKTLRDIAN